MIRKNPSFVTVLPAIGSGALHPYGTIAAASACNKEDRFASLKQFQYCSTVLKSRTVHIQSEVWRCKCVEVKKWDVCGVLARVCCHGRLVRQLGLPVGYELDENHSRTECGGEETISFSAGVNPTSSPQRSYRTDRDNLAAYLKGKFHPTAGHEGPEGKQKLSSALSLTSALDGGGWLTSRPSRFTPGKETCYLFYRRLGGPQSRSGRVRKISIPRPSSPQRGAILTTLSQSTPAAYVDKIMILNKR